MLNIIKNKIRQNRGASLTFALLLFLVCAAVGSVVLASASAAAGRASGNFDYDQRYYAVTSAAELFRDELNGQSLTVELSETTTRTDTVTVRFDAENNPVGDPVLTEGTPPNVEYGKHVKRGTDDIPATTSNLLDQALLDLLGDRSEKTLFDAGSLNAAGDGEAKTLTLTVSDYNTEAELTGLKVTVTEKLLRDGSLYFTFENYVPDGATGDRYKLQMTLTADKTVGTKTEEWTVWGIPEPDTDAAGPFTRQEGTYEKTVTQTHVITWRASSITPA